MIVGSGLIGENLRKIDRDDVLFFASGVSDSQNSTIEDYEREKNLILKYSKDLIGKPLLFVYFSTYSIDDPDSNNKPYVQHKIQIEQLIKQKFDLYLIVRTSNLVGDTGNPKNLVRYICNRIVDGEYFELWRGAYRNILDIDHFIAMLDYIISKRLYTNQIVYLVNPAEYSVLDIVKVCEKKLGKKAMYKTIDKGAKFSYDMNFSLFVFDQLKFDSLNYVEAIVLKYFVDIKK